MQASTDLVPGRRHTMLLEHFSRLRPLFVVWAMAMRLVSWRHETITPGPGDAA